MVSSLIGPQYHDDQFWKFAESAGDGETNDFNVAMLPTFADNFEVNLLTRKDLVRITYKIFSTLTSMALMMEPSSTMDRILDLPSSRMQRSSLLNCKTCKDYQKLRILSSGLTTSGPGLWDSQDLRWLTVMGWMLVVSYRILFLTSSNCQELLPSQHRSTSICLGDVVIISLLVSYNIDSNLSLIRQF